MNRFIKIIQKLQVEYIDVVHKFNVFLFNREQTGVSIIVEINERKKFFFFSFWTEDDLLAMIDELKNYLKELSNGRKNDTSRET